MNTGQRERRRRLILQRIGVDRWRPREAPAATEQKTRFEDAPQPDAEAAAATVEATPSGAAAGSVASMDWQTLQDTVAECTLCPLCASRSRTVFGVGRADADILVVGEAPGAEEDRQGEPFVGRAGQLLDNMLRALGYSREQVFIANMLKCRPPRNRDPEPSEVAACWPYLDRQIELVAPQVILAVGRIAAQSLLATDRPLRTLRQGSHQLPTRDVPVVVSYHPAYLLRSPQDKAKAWQDLRRLRGHLKPAMPKEEA